MKKLKRLITQISCIALVGAMMLFNTDGGATCKTVFDMGVNCITASAAANGTNPSSSSGTHTSVTGWRTSNNIAFRLYFTSIDDAIDGGNRRANVPYSLYVMGTTGKSADYIEKPSIIWVNENDISDVASVPIDMGTTPEGACPVIKDTKTNVAEYSNQEFADLVGYLQAAVRDYTGQGYGFSAEDFLNGAGLSTLATNLNTLIDTKETDAVYKGYLEYMENTYGENEPIDNVAL